MTNAVRFMAFYDVKDARLVERRDDEPIYQREPKVDMEQFIHFCQVANNLMQPNRDLVWTFLGMCDSSGANIKKHITMLGWNSKPIHMFYARAQLAKYGHIPGCGKHEQL
ncbi:hypothetical protein N9L68_09010 [bacterium]|nr:hypothetical protein [bacterium]